MPRRLLIALTLTVAACNGNPNAPTGNPAITVSIMTIRYERAHPFDDALTGRMELWMHHAIPGDGRGRYDDHLCTLQPVGDGTFGCLDSESRGNAFTRVPVNTEVIVRVIDPAISSPSAVGSRIWINGQLVTRTRQTGEVESGLFVFPLFSDRLR